MKLFVVFTIALIAGIQATLQVDPECVGIRNGSTFRLKEDCASYFSCQNGKLLWQKCPAGLNWDQVQHMCQVPEKVQCEIGPFLTPITTTTEAPVWTTPPVILTTGIVPIEENSEAISGYTCPSIGIASIPHKESCSKYVICFDGTPITQSCAPGLQFDATSGQCTFPVFANCTVDDLICPAWDDLNKLVFIADKFDCAKYYYCYNGKSHPNRCAEGLHWDPVNNWCTPIEMSRCSNFTPYEEVDEPMLTPKTVTCTGDSAYWVEHPKSCRHYYLCYKSKAILKRCDEGLYWDHGTGSCNYAGRSSCRK
ncbi:protein obstructor-E-like [Uranotaenia lowii]|uniref:protein obstructor-E-like n=1 Tax=Uranotaenia lowii TaxID=190385 RepID=UPI00247AD515|nr:protein obstructor-E-like [Uranotaenia lowii]